MFLFNVKFRYICYRVNVYIDMRFKQILIRLPKENYVWLKKHAYFLGETMTTIVKVALDNYRKNLK